MKRLALLAVVVLAAVSLAGCGSGTQVAGSGDSDRDGLSDAQEVAGWTVVVDQVGKRVAWQTKSDPHNNDTDGDGLTDYFEFTFIPPTDPTKKDTDGDGLTDCQELLETNESICEDPAYTGDYDGGYGTSATRQDSDPGPSRYVSKQPFEDTTGTLTDGHITWGDGLPDGMEVAGYNITVGDETRFVHTDPLAVDTDKDGLEDGEEVLQFHSDPTVADTDGDGCPDGYDIFPSKTVQYVVHIDRFQWNGSGQDSLVFWVLYGDQYLRLPAAGGVAVDGGQTQDVAVRSDPISIACKIRTVDGIVNLQVFATLESAASKRLDIYSGQSGHDSHAYFAPRDGAYSWEQHGQDPIDAPDGLVHWTGTDGQIWFHVSVE